MGLGFNHGSQSCLAALSLALGVACCGCGVTGEDPGPGPGSGGPPSPQDPLPLNVVQVEFRNLSPAAVDTQFYAADVSTNGLPASLFVPANRVTSGIGNAATGILAPGETDLAAFPCSDDLAVGTEGGEFLDPNLGTVLGQGPTRFVQSRYQFDCGAVLIIEYNQTTGGYTTYISEDR